MTKELNEKTLVVLKEFQDLLEEESIYSTIDTIVNMFDSEIHEFMWVINETNKHNILINSDKYKELEAKTMRKVKAFKDDNNA